MKQTATNEYHRGDLFYYDFGDNEGSIQCGCRPVMILQADEINEKAPTVIVAAITSAVGKRYLPSHIYLGETSGLNRPSMVMIEQIRTVNKSDLQEYIGTVGGEKIWKVINNAIKKTFGLWFYKQEQSDVVRCLCPRCLKEYMADPAYKIRRVDPFATIKGRCDKCDGMGYDYIVSDKRVAARSRVSE